MRAGPAQGGCHTTWGEAARGRETSWLDGAGWDQPHTRSSLPGTTLEVLLEDHGVDLTALVCMQKFVSQTHSMKHAFSLHQGRTDSHAGEDISSTVHPVLSSSEEKYRSLQLPGLGGLCVSSLDGMMWVRRHLLCILTHDTDGDPFRSARGFYLLLGPVCSPLIQIAALVRLIPFS